MNDFTGSIGNDSNSRQSPNIEAAEATTKPFNMQTYEKANDYPKPNPIHNRSNSVAAFSSRIPYVPLSVDHNVNPDKEAPNVSPEVVYAEAPGYIKILFFLIFCMETNEGVTYHNKITPIGFCSASVGGVNYGTNRNP